MKAVRSLRTGAKSSQRSGGNAAARVCARQTRTPRRLAASATSARVEKLAREKLQEPLYVPETLTGMELLEQMRDQPSRMLFVVDEYGEVQGLLTPLDLLEAITGELKPDTHTEAWATQRADGSWLLDGLMPVNELKSRLDIKDLPAEDKGRYNTLAGLILYVLGQLPVVGQCLDLDEWTFEIIDLDGRRIDKVLATKTP